jgi:hypothetical protein
VTRIRFSVAEYTVVDSPGVHGSGRWPGLHNHTVLEAAGTAASSVTPEVKATHSHARMPTFLDMRDGTSAWIDMGGKSTH